MPEESTNTEYRATTRTAPHASQEVDASSVQHLEPSVKPSPMRGYSLSVGQRRTRAMLPTRKRSVVSHKLNLAAWHKPYGEALLETDPEALVKLLAATESAVFERLLELTADEDVSDEGRDIRRAIDVMLTLKTRRARSKISPVGLPELGLRAMRDRVTALGGTVEILTEGDGTTFEVVIPLPEPPMARRVKPA